jgi:hypothetical protein
MTAAYLKWRYHPTEQATSGPTNLDFNIDIVDVYSLAWSAYIPRSEDSKSPLEALALHGYIGNAPLSPSMAVSIKTLELYRRIRLRKPGFSIEAFAKVICDLYAVREGYFLFYFLANLP